MISNIVSLVFIAFLSLVVFSLFAGSFSRSNPRFTAAIEAAEKDLESIEAALELYSNLGGFFPSEEQGLAALITKPVTDPVPRRWIASLREVPCDPWGNHYRYQFSGLDSSDKPVIVSAGPDQVFDTEDDLSNRD